MLLKQQINILEWCLKDRVKGVMDAEKKALPSLEQIILCCIILNSFHSITVCIFNIHQTIAEHL